MSPTTVVDLTVALQVVIGVVAAGSSILAVVRLFVERRNHRKHFHDNDEVRKRLEARKKVIEEKQALLEEQARRVDQGIARLDSEQLEAEQHNLPREAL